MPIQTVEINLDLEPEVLTDKEDTKTLPCRSCGRPCVVTRFASPLKTECTACRHGQTPAVGPDTNASDEHDTLVVSDALMIDPSLEVEILTDKEATKTVPCRKCQRACVVTTFATASKVECLTCRGKDKADHKEKVQVQQAQTVNPAKLEHLVDGLINPAFRTLPLCPFDPEHQMELKNIVHSPAYGPRHLVRYDKGMPIYDQQIGESVVYQCDTCYTVVSYSTMHPLNLRAQNEPRTTTGHGSILAAVLGTREDHETA